MRLSSFIHTHTHSLNWGAWVREEVLTLVRERTTVGDHLFCLWVLLLPLVLILSLRKLQGFILYGFPKENSLCLLSLVIIDVHVILSVKILRSYCLNYKNITILCRSSSIFSILCSNTSIFLILCCNTTCSTHDIFVGWLIHITLGHRSKDDAILINLLPFNEEGP